MNSSLNKLRKKYIITASLIVFAVVLLMIITLNFLMRFSYKNEGKIIESVIEQAAVSHLNQPVNEHFDLSEADKTESGDYKIPRSVKDISKITVYGNISYDGSVDWYSAGGGLLFGAEIDGSTQWVHKKYQFNDDTTSISIDFNNYDNIRIGEDTISIDESQIVSDYFLLSVIWWKSSSNGGDDENIKITVDSIDINYKNEATIPSSNGSLIAHSSFADIFENNIPEVLNNTGSFYLVVNSNNRLLSINDGNLMNPLENSEARGYAQTILNSDKKNGKITKDKTTYSYSIHQEDGMKIIIFINDSFTHTANGNLLKISILVGGVIFFILFVFIVIVSGYVIKPVADSMERQKQFISDASHELKTPITVISTTIDIIGNKNGKDRWTECIKEQAVKMQRLVKELLDLSKLLEVNTARSGFKINDISNTVNNSLLYFESLLFESGKTLEQDIEENIRLNCDENKISQLVGILMDNALKYSDEKSKICFSLKKNGDYAVISCSNPCSDFSASDTSKLFERFFRSENDRIHEQEGFGLGLSIAQAIAELHGGKISSTYENNIITFTVLLNT
ncbi:MAG: HAMP domain-containing histidine kinase [Ruminococcus flavefaciens]|nr:HAMP domain-containing histidine kinase [Ruminococcus flavefaciens]MCM1362816.1 HAMP domain-containing histidine kinase [Clostridiales bacterium]MCM1436017.1 HAMP domain-containing histidine kinase [Ruminococcus flavefaciens]